MQKSVRIGMIGCGGIASGKHMQGLEKIDGVHMVAFCDIVPHKAEAAALQFGAEGAKTYGDYRKLLEDPSIDAVHVCTPNDSHAEITVAALEAGKHVMCEKPMAKTSIEAQTMLDAAARTGRKLTIAYQNRFRSDSQHLYQMCRRGDLGDIYFAKAHAVRRRGVPTQGVFIDEQKQGGGPLIDIGTHALDLTLWMMDNYKPKMVVGTSYHQLSRRHNAANAWGPWDPDKFTVEDSAFGFVVMENGATIILESSWALNTLQTGEARCTLCGTERGADMWDGLRINGEEFGQLYVNQVQSGAKGVDFYESKAEKAGDKEAESWIRALREDREPVVRPEQAFVVARILDAIYASARTGQPVYLN